MKILVIGAAGFIGSNLIHRLIKQEISHVGIDNLRFGYRENLPPICNFVKQDQKEIDAATMHTHGYDVMVHVACSNIIYAMENPVQTMINNAVNTIQVMSRFKGKIVYTSTASVYGNSRSIPTYESDRIRLSNAYDTSKRIVEQYLQARGNFTTLRLSNVYGPRQRPENPYCGVIGKFMEQFRDNKPITIFGDGQQTRDYTYVLDVIDAIMEAIQAKPLETELNIATGKETSVMELAELIAGKQYDFRFVPARRIDKIERRCLHIANARRLLNWKPKYTLQEGIDQTMKFLSQ